MAKPRAPYAAAMSTETAGRQERRPFRIAGEGDEPVFRAKIDDDIPPALAQAPNVGAAAMACSVPYDEPGAGEAGHFPIFRTMERACARRSIGPDLPDRPYADIVTGNGTTAEDRDVTHAALGKKVLDSSIRAGGITDHDRQFLVDDHAKPLHHAGWKLPDGKRSGDEHRRRRRPMVRGRAGSGHGKLPDKCTTSPPPLLHVGHFLVSRQLRFWLRTCPGNAPALLARDRHS